MLENAELAPALGLGAPILLTGRHLAPGDDTARTASVLLATLTLPHIWLEWRLQRGPAGGFLPATPTTRRWAASSCSQPRPTVHG